MTACTYLGVTGQRAELYAALALDYPDPLEHQKLAQLIDRLEAATWEIGNPEVLQEFLMRANAGDGKAFSAVVAYVRHSAVDAELLS